MTINQLLNGIKNVLKSIRKINQSIIELDFAVKNWIINHKQFNGITNASTRMKNIQKPIITSVGFYKNHKNITKFWNIIAKMILKMNGF